MFVGKKINLPPIEPQGGRNVNGQWLQNNDVSIGLKFLFDDYLTGRGCFSRNLLIDQYMFF